MSEHVEIQTLLAVYEDLAPQTRQQIEQHLPTCRECTETLAAYQTMDRALHRLVEDKLHCLAAQPMHQPCTVQHAVLMKPFTPSQQPASWLKTWARRLTQQRLVALQLAGAGILILLLVVLSMLFAAWKPEQEYRIASTPTIEHPVATATPQLKGEWASEVADSQGAARPLATAAQDEPTGLKQASEVYAQLSGILDQATFAEFDKTKMATLMMNTTAVAPGYVVDVHEI